MELAPLRRLDGLYVAACRSHDADDWARYHAALDAFDRRFTWGGSHQRGDQPCL